MEYTAWSLLADAGMIGGLLLVGTVVRARVRPAQRLMLPASVIAGFVGLALGPNVLGVLPFSDQLEAYSSVLIVVVFACLALTEGMGFRGVGRGTATLSAYSMAMYALQVGVGMIAGLALLGPIWGTHDGFGVLLVGGWAGGFGSAAALGSAFGGLGWEEAGSLAFTSATVGLLTGIIGGVALNNWAARSGHAAALGRFDDWPEEQRSGLVPDPDQRPSIGAATVSPATIEPLVLQVCVIAAISAGAYGLSEWFGTLLPQAEVPVFALAFLVGLVVRLAFRRTAAWRYVDPRTLRSVSGSATDILVVCGIASIVPQFVREHWLPLVALFVIGLALCLVMLLLVAPALFREAWFEKAIFTWGWSTGAVATGVALLRMIDPHLRSRTLEEFGLAYLPVAPVETATISFAPALVMAGAGWAMGGGWAALGLVALVLPWLLGWTPRRPRGREHVS